VCPLTHVSFFENVYNDHRMAKSIENSIDFAAKRQVWQRMIPLNHSRDAHCNKYMAPQPCCSAEQQSCSAERLEAFRHHIFIINNPVIL